MARDRKILRCIAIVILYICTAFLWYSIISDPLGEQSIMFPLAVTAGFIALDSSKNKNKFK
ncbi:MAG: hypothetical protein ACRC3H_06725 [Lachnospiraceae bacterium]